MRTILPELDGVVRSKINHSFSWSIQMLHGSFQVSTFIKATPGNVFEYVSDLTRHGEWSANPLRVEALSPGKVGVGSRYRSVAQSRRVTFDAALEVTEYSPSYQFAFKGEDSSGKFSHVFTFEPRDDGTFVTRDVRFELNFGQWLFFLALLYLVRIPLAKLALQRLKKKMEAGN
jgi:hypothetical protein